MRDRVLNATVEQLEKLDELYSEYSNEFMKPEVIGATWEYYTEALIETEDEGLKRQYDPDKVFYFGRMSASGFLDATEWTWDEDFDDLIETLREDYPPL